MSIETKVWLYGTRTAKTKSKEKKYIRLPSEQIAKAKAIHIFIKKTPRSAWKKITDDLLEIPSFIRSKVDKEIYIDSLVETIKLEYLPKPKKKPEPKLERPIVLPPPPKPAKEKKVELPRLPEEPRVSITKRQFEAQLARVLFDELDLQNLKWSKQRINSFISKMWRAYNHAPHLIAREDFKRELVTKEIKRVKDALAKKERGQLEEAYRKELDSRDVSLDPEDVAGEVKVQFKEVFNTQYLPRPLDPREESQLTPEQRRERDKRQLQIKTLQDGMVVDKDRQAVFAQILVDYDKSIIVGKDALFGSDEMSTMAFNKVREDMEKLFSQAIKKGLFRESSDPEYSFRVLVPLVDSKGHIPESALSRSGKKRVGHGFSTPRVKIKNRRDLRKALDDLYESMLPALTRYIKLNHSAGFMIAGFSIERLIK